MMRPKIIIIRFAHRGLLSLTIQYNKKIERIINKIGYASPKNEMAIILTNIGRQIAQYHYEMKAELIK